MTPPIVIPPRPILYALCAWHTPQAEIDALNLAYPGQVTHTMCTSCAEKFEQEVA